jgi:dihydrofolate synthase/folylpolyglutamate synthase
MTVISSFSEAQDALRQFYGAPPKGAYTLDRMRELMKFLGNPERGLHVVHVAGTSGKTSTAYYVASLLTAAGKKVGLTVSPHVDEINERVQINGVPLAQKEFFAELNEFLKLIKSSGIVPSYFEFMIALAFWVFARQKVDYAVVEVGLGGSLDGTNVTDEPDKVCVITDIGLDHTEILGDTLGKIANQKAGIIKKRNHVFMYRQADEINDAVATTVQHQTAKLHLVPDSSATVAGGDLPAFQKRNLWLAAYVANYVLQRDAGDELTTEQIHHASQTLIPARMEIVTLKDKTLVIDGAHNAQKLQTLFSSLKERFPGKQVAALVGFVDGDPFRLHQALEVITQNTEHITVTSFYGEKDYPRHSVPTDQVVVQCHELGFNEVNVQETPAIALSSLLNRPEDILLVAGSFYLLNHIRPLIKRGMK